MKRKLTTYALILSTMLLSWTMSATQPVKVEDSMKKIAAEYENTEGVESFVIQKGEGLGLIKALFGKQFGKKFMKGVTSMVMIDYSKASDEVAASLRESLESFKGVLEELDIEEELNEGEYMKCYATKVGSKKVSDFMFIGEDHEAKMVMYMGGELDLTNLDL